MTRTRFAMTVVVAITALLTGACVPAPAPPRTEKERVDLSSPDRGDETIDDSGATGGAGDEPVGEPLPGHPERPKAMERTDEIGAAAAATYFVELERYVFRTGDLTEWIRISDQRCSWCWGMASIAAAVRAEGGEIVGGEPTWGPAVPFVPEKEPGSGFSFDLDLGPTSVVDASGTVVATVGGNQSVVDVVVKHTAGGWRLMNGQARGRDTDRLESYGYWLP